MLSNWFAGWNKANPTDVYRPAVAIGVVGGAIVLATLLVTLGQPFKTTSMQTGPRGEGAIVVKMASAMTRPDPTVADYQSQDPIIPKPGDPLAKDTYKNVQVLGDLTTDNFTRVMLSMTQWVAPDQGCAFCHGDGALETYSEDTLYTKVIARKMLQMTQNINENWSGHVNFGGDVGVNCFTCHRGQNIPTGIWYRIDPVSKATAGWASVQNRVTSQSQWTSLPSDALEKYLLEGQNILVSAQDVRDRTNKATIQDTERTFSLMNYIDNALNVNCTFCHSTRAFWDAGQVTPQWATALLGIQMVNQLNNDYLAKLEGVFPAQQLGPVHADVPKLACATCHKGYQKPLGGMSMIKDWPELASSTAPKY